MGLQGCDAIAGGDDSLPRRPAVRAAAALRRAIHDRGWSLPYREFLSTVCPYVSVGDHATYADYVAAHFSYASRRNIRRYPKRFREITGAAVERVSAPVAGTMTSAPWSPHCSTHSPQPLQRSETKIEKMPPSPGFFFSIDLKMAGTLL